MFKATSGFAVQMIHQCGVAFEDSAETFVYVVSGLAQEASISGKCNRAFVKREVG